MRLAIDNGAQAQGIEIELVALEGYFQEILPRYEDLLSADPDGFRRKFALFKEKIAALP